MEVVGDFKTKFDKMDKMMTLNEEQMLHRIVYKAERTDRKSGITPREFKRLLCNLPKKYKDIVEEKNELFSFENLDQSSDGIINHQEVHDLVRQLSEHSQKRGEM